MFPPSSSAALMLRLWAPVTAALRELEQVVGLVPASAGEPGEALGEQTGDTPAPLPQPIEVQGPAAIHAVPVAPSATNARATSPAATNPAAASPVLASPVATSPVATSPVLASPVATSPVPTSPTATGTAPAAPTPRGPVAVLRRRELPPVAPPAPRVLAHLVDLKPAAQTSESAQDHAAAQPLPFGESPPPQPVAQILAAPEGSSSPRPTAQQRPNAPEQAPTGPLPLASPAPQPQAPLAARTLAPAPSAQGMQDSRPSAAPETAPILDPAPGPAPAAERASAPLPLSPAPPVQAALPTLPEPQPSPAASPLAPRPEPAPPSDPLQTTSQRPAWRDLVPSAAPTASPLDRSDEPAPRRPAWSQLPTAAGPRPTRSKPLALAPAPRTVALAPAPQVQESSSAPASVQTAELAEATPLAAQGVYGLSLPPAPASRGFASPRAAAPSASPLDLPSAPQRVEPSPASPLDPITFEETLSDVLRSALRRHGVEL